MHVDDRALTAFLIAAIQKRKKAAGVISMPVRYHNALDRAKRCPEAGQVAGERYRVRTGVEQRESVRVRCFICFLVDLRQPISRIRYLAQVHTIRAEKP